MSIRMDKLDRRYIFLFVAISLMIPLVLGVSLRPAEMATAKAFFDKVQSLEPAPGKIVLISADWGPGTLAENRPQTMLVMEHLMRKRIPFALISVYVLASPFLRETPEAVARQLEQEFPGERWEYGKDWVNLGYQPNSLIMVEGLAKSSDWHQHLKADANGASLQDLPLMQDVRSIRDVLALMEFTGLQGVFNLWLQYFQTEGYRPPFLHGCTSVTIPEAFIYYASNQIVGLFEGIAGAAYYELLLDQHYETRNANVAIRVNTGLSFAQLLVIFLIVLGNLSLLFSKRPPSRNSE